MTEKIQKSDAEWRNQLTAEQFDITRQKGTERPGTGEYYQYHGSGTFRCVCCEEPLFSGEHKYDSGSGWPSFWQPLQPEKVETERDLSYGMVRTEIKCARCDAHLGHVFEDGPEPTGLRYCVNSASLKLEE